MANFRHPRIMKRLFQADALSECRTGSRGWRKDLGVIRREPPQGISQGEPIVSARK